MSGTINYKFDCTNNGTWELEINNTTQNPYTATDLCNYPAVGTYTAKVLVERGTGSAQDTTTITVSANQPPVAGICCQSCASPNCTAYTGDVFTLINNSSDPNGTDDIAKSEWDILSWGADPDLRCTSPSALCNFTPSTQILGKGNFTVELYVEDLAGASNTTTKTFTILQDAIADFKCSLDNTTWKTCETIRPSVGEVVYFLDQSTPSDGATILHRSWTFPDGTPASDTDNNTNPSSGFQSAGQKQVILTVTDSAGRSDSESHFITVLLPLPEWEEIPPF